MDIKEKIEKLKNDIEGYKNTIWAYKFEYHDLEDSHRKEVIEAFEHKLYPWLGWMWHPEREKVFNKKNLSLARKFFNKKYEN